MQIAAASSPALLLSCPALIFCFGSFVFLFFYFEFLTYLSPLSTYPRTFTALLSCPGHILVSKSPAVLLHLPVLDPTPIYLASTALKIFK